ncbi:MAG: type II toxin-antitoxin system RelE/ParE family toxin [Azoarcus sp.]|nr:type II toxin-antitoxin system RelE/ParE family toxin [Azoarcus sp.]
MLGSEPAMALETVELIAEAVQILENHPLVGRPAEQGMRALLISRGRTGYLALYSDEEARDTMLMLALRHQREAGYTSPLAQRAGQSHPLLRPGTPPRRAPPFE